MRVVPDDVPLPPIWVLGSSGATAAFAGSIGLGYGFARHFSPDAAGSGRFARIASAFMPSAQFPAPHVILGVSVDLRADGTRRPTTWPRPPTSAGSGCIVASSCRCRARKRRARYQYSPQERVVVEMNRQRHFIGTPLKVASMIRNIVDDDRVDEIMVTSMIYGRMQRFRGYELLASEFGLRDDQDGLKADNFLNSGGFGSVASHDPSTIQPNRGAAGRQGS